MAAEPSARPKTGHAPEGGGGDDDDTRAHSLFGTTMRKTKHHTVPYIPGTMVCTKSNVRVQVELKSKSGDEKKKEGKKKTTMKKINQ